MLNQARKEFSIVKGISIWISELYEYGRSGNSICGRKIY